MNAIAKLIANLAPVDCEHYAAAVSVLGIFTMKLQEIPDVNSVLTSIVTDDGSTGLNRGVKLADYTCLYACCADGASLVRSAPDYGIERRCLELYIVAEKDHHIQLEVRAGRVFPQQRERRNTHYTFTFELQRPSYLDVVAFAEVLVTNARLFFSCQIDALQFSKHPGVNLYDQQDRTYSSTQRLQDLPLEQKLPDAVAADTPTAPNTH